MATRKLGETDLHKSTLMIGDMPTEEGRIYPMDLCVWLAERLGRAPQIIVEEVSPLERRLKKINEAEPWPEKAMGIVVGAEMNGAALDFYFRCKGTREGKRLDGMIKQFGIEAIKFIPVGYGETDETGRIKPGYQLNYIAVEMQEQFAQPSINAPQSAFQEILPNQGLPYFPQPNQMNLGRKFGNRIDGRR